MTDDGVGSSGGGLGGALVVVLGEMLVTSWSSIDQELPTFSRLWLLEAKLRLWRLPNLPPPLPPPEDASDDEAGVTGDSRCLMWSCTVVSSLTVDDDVNTPEAEAEDKVGK